MFNYDLERLEGLGFDLNYVEKALTKREPKVPTDEMVVAPYLSQEPGRNSDTFFLSEGEGDAFHSTKPNGGMASTQLKIAKEKIDILLSLVDEDDNFEPWVATKINNAAVNLASVADYLRFGGET